MLYTQTAVLNSPFFAYYLKFNLIIMYPFYVYHANLTPNDQLIMPE